MGEIEENKEHVENYDVEGLDILDILRVFNRKHRVYQRLLLTALEEAIPDKELFIIVRKTVLDYFNDFARSYARALVGEDMER